MGNPRLLLEAAMVAVVVSVEVAVEEVQLLLQHRKSQMMVEEVPVQVLVQDRNSPPTML